MQVKLEGKYFITIVQLCDSLKFQTPENLGTAAYLTCCQSGKKISFTSCRPHLKCEPRFHIDDSKNQFKVSCALVCARKKRATSNSNKKESEEIFTVTSFVLYNSQFYSANSKVTLLQEDSNSRNIFLMKIIIEVQWYICLKEQIHQHILMNDVCRNLFGFEEEDSERAVEVRNSSYISLIFTNLVAFWSMNLERKTSRH